MDFLYFAVIYLHKNRNTIRTMSGGMSQCSRNIRIPEFPMTSLKALPKSSMESRLGDISPPRVTLTQASRPSTTSAHGDFTGN